MWGKGDKKGATAGGHHETTLIAAGTRIEGDIRFVGDLHLEGQVRGNIYSEQGRICLAETGRIEGEVRAPHVVLNGAVNGNVVATERLDLKAQAVISGNVYYRLIEMAIGAQVNGSLERMGELEQELPALSCSAAEPALLEES